MPVLSSLSLLANHLSSASAPISFPSKYGIFADGNYINHPDAVALADGDFTIEGFVKPTSIKSQPYVSGFTQSQEHAGLATYFLDDLSIAIGASGIGDDLRTSANALTLNVWQHVAFVKSNSELSIYVNGVLIATTSSSTSYVSSSFALSHWNSAYSFLGNMSNVRISNNARYSGSSFSVPSEAFVSDASTLQLALNDVMFESGLVNYGVTLVGIAV